MTTPKMDVAQMMKDFAFSMRKLAEEAGTDCDVPGCDALTLGFRCENCSRRLCNTHAFWQFGSGRMTSLCPYCVLAANTQLFETGEDDDDDDTSATDDEGADDDVIDAEFEET